MNTARLTDQADWSYSNGHRGAGARIAVVEYDNVDWNAQDLGLDESRWNAYSTTGTKTYEDHPTWVMGAIASTTSGRRGISPDAFYISSGTGGWVENQRDYDVMEAVDNAVLASKGDADVVNLSFVQDTTAGKTAMRAYIDHAVRTYNMHAAAAAGNRPAGHCPSNYVQSPGTGWNVVTVGGIDDNNSSGWGDDSVWNGTCYLDPNGGTFKPEIAAPAVCIVVNGSNCLESTGTSIASPQVAGALGNLVGYDPTALRAYPEKTKAIILAATGEHRTSGDSSGMGDREGLGSLTTEWADKIAERRVANGYKVGNFGGWQASGVLEGGCYFGPSSHYIGNIDPEPGRKVRMVISWNSHGFYNNGGSYDSGDSYSDQRWSDIDLVVKDRNGNTVDVSASLNYTVEWADWTASNQGPYTAEIRPFSWNCDLSQEFIGWAWAAWP
jgi:Subtilase family